MSDEVLDVRRQPPEEESGELDELRRRLEEAEETLEAIRRGEVDAFVVSSGDGEQIFALETADRPFRIFVETMNQGAATLSADGIVLYTNQRLAELLGLSREKLLGASLSDLAPDEDRSGFVALLRAGEAGSAQGEVPLRRADGTPLPAYFSLSALPEGEATVCAVISDLTEQKRHEAVRESEARFRQLAESLPQLVWTCRPDGSCDYLSRQWVDYTGVSASRHLGYGWLEAIHPEDLEATRGGWAEAVAKVEPFDLDFRIRGADGVHRWFKSRAVPIFDDDGALFKWFGSNTDIDVQKRAEQALKEADVRKDEFLAMLAHELRNPLAPVATAVEILRAEERQPGSDRAQALEIIQRQVRQMSRLVDDLLDISRITRGTVRVEKKRIELGTLVTSALETSRPLIESRGHDLQVSLPSEPVYLEGDLTRLSQVVSNLLNNAAKYSAEGGRIWLTARWEPESPFDASGNGGGPQVVVTVRDEGVGIAADQLATVFDLFTQLDRGASSAGGLGVGLALVRSLVGLHGGTVEARSAGAGAGAEFVVRLPALDLDGKGAAAEDEATSERLAPAAQRVLVVDDNVDAADSLGMLLELLGHEVRIAHDGARALAQAREFVPQVVICDIGLPDVDGREVCRRLRRRPETRDALVIALTGYGTPEDHRSSNEAGFDHHLVKPVDPERLRRLLEP